MAKSPGHQTWPEHQVREEHVDHRVQVEIGGEVVADSDDVIRVREDKHPARYYFPRTDIRMDKLARSETTTQCPFKGTAHYYSLTVGGEQLPDAVFTYEEPFDEHAALKDRVAFYAEKIPQLQIREAG